MLDACVLQALSNGEKALHSNLIDFNLSRIDKRAVKITFGHLLAF